MQRESCSPRLWFDAFLGKPEVFKQSRMIVSFTNFCFQHTISVHSRSDRRIKTFTKQAQQPSTLAKQVCQPVALSQGIPASSQRSTLILNSHLQKQICYLQVFAERKFSPKTIHQSLDLLRDSSEILYLVNRDPEPYPDHSKGGSRLQRVNIHSEIQILKNIQEKE